MKILEIARLTEKGFSQREIARSVNCSRNTVSALQARYRELTVALETLETLNDKELKQLFYPNLGTTRKKPEPDWESIAERLSKSSRVNMSYLWEDYAQTTKDPLRYSQFCERFKQWRKTTGADVVMAQSREPGHELFVDWSGDVLSCLVDRDTGEIIPSYLFVSTLGDSGYPFAKAYTDMKQQSWLGAHVSALEHYGGLPKIIVPDNCKTAISKPSYYDPKVNVGYAELARHYDVAIIPARIKKPTDKASVESSVGWLQTWLCEHLADTGPYFSVAELNAAIISRLKTLIERPYQKRAGTRRIAFEQIDRPALREHPKTAFEVRQTISRVVPNYYHVSFENVNYSVPYQLFGQKVFLRVGRSSVEITDASMKRVALHMRSTDPIKCRYVTDPAHMPPHHEQVYNFNRRDGAWYRHYARSIGPQTEVVIDTLLKRQRHEECAYRSVHAILDFSRRYTPELLEKVCAQAREVNQIGYKTIKQLCTAYEKQPILPPHENLRAASSFR